MMPIVLLLVNSGSSQNGNLIIALDLYKALYVADV